VAERLRPARPNGAPRGGEVAISVSWHPRRTRLMSTLICHKFVLQRRAQPELADHRGRIAVALEAAAAWHDGAP